MHLIRHLIIPTFRRSATFPCSKFGKCQCNIGITKPSLSSSTRGSNNCNVAQISKRPYCRGSWANVFRRKYSAETPTPPDKNKKFSKAEQDTHIKGKPDPFYPLPVSHNKHKELSTLQTIISTDVKETRPLQPIIHGDRDNKGAGDPIRPHFYPQADETQENENAVTDGPPLSAPTNCCRSGCPNCVWVDYVEQLTQRYLNPDLSRERILKELDSLEDQSIKAFIKLELKSRGLL